jgi:hypothetical protein
MLFAINRNRNESNISLGDVLAFATRIYSIIWTFTRYLSRDVCHAARDDAYLPGIDILIDGFISRIYLRDE